MSRRKLNSQQQAEKVTRSLIEIRKKDGGKLFREADVGNIDQEARTVELSFSSEAEYERWFGIEVLGHGASEVRMGRITNKAPVLWMHDWDDQRGVVESARIDGDARGRALCRFSRSPAGDQLFQDIVDGIVTKVSVGYMVHGLKLVEERDDIDVYRVTDWEPFEISMVSVPADDTVGVGRSAENPQEESAVDQAEDSAITDTAPDEGAILRTIEIMDQNASATPANNSAAERQAGADAERARVRAITEMGKQYGQAEKAAQFVLDGKSPEDFQRELLHSFAVQRGNKPLEEQQRDASIGMSQREVRQFSIFRAIRALDPQATKEDREAAAFEFECSRAAAQLYGKEAKGIIIPGDVLMDRAFGTGGNGTSGNGSAAIATNLLPGSFIDILRNRAWVMKRARTMAGLVGNVDIPKQTSTSNVYWVGEGGAPTPGQPGLDQISFTPKTVGAYTDITRRLLKQSTPDAEAIVRDDIIKNMALGIDKVAIYGTGTEFQPKGLKNYTGINAVDFATASKPSYAELVQMETEIALDNADVDSMSYAFNAQVRGNLKTTLKFPGVNGSAAIWEPGNTVNGYATDVSNQIATGDVFLGNWADLVIALWGGLELTIDPYALSTSGGLRLIALQDIDINLRRVESFCWGSDLVA